MAVLLVVVGSLLVGLVLTDVFFTVFHPTAHAGPLTRFQSRTVWRATRRVGGCGGRTRERVLSVGGPVIAALTPVAWLLLLVVGFTLIHYPFVLSFAFSPENRGARWLDSFYYSGYLATTLGLGDIVPRAGVFRLLAVFEAFLGFGLFSVGITYVLSIYTQLSAQMALATTIDHALADADPMDWRNPDPTELQWSFTLARHVAQQLSRANRANSQYPILQYFRHPHPRDALAVQVGRLIRWLHELEAASPERDWFRSRSPFRTLRRAVDEYIREVPQHLLPGRDTGEDVDWDREHARLLHYLCYDDVPSAAAPGRAREPGR